MTYVLLIMTDRDSGMTYEVYGQSEDVALLHQVGQSMALTHGISYRVLPLKPIPV